MKDLRYFLPPIFFSDPEDRALYFPRWGSEGVEWKNLEKIPGEFARRVMTQSTQTKLVNPETGETITERGVVGELRYKSPVVFAGYWKRPDLTAQVFDDDGYYCSGDLFSIEGEKMDRFLFRGRYKDLIIRGGQNISPVEIEHLVGATRRSMKWQRLDILMSAWAKSSALSLFQNLEKTLHWKRSFVI